VVRQRFLAQGERNVVVVPLSVSGHCLAVLHPQGGPPQGVEVAVFPHAVDFNQVFYDPRVFGLADYVLTSGAVRGRFEADSIRFRREVDLYRRLDRAADVVARFRPEGGRVGPEIVIYRLGDRFRSTLAPQGRLDPLWW